MAEGSLKFLFDENLSPVLVRVLRNLGENTIHHHRAVFPGGADDEHWIPKATSLGFVCITLDHKMTTDRTVAPILAATKARMIFLRFGRARMDRWQQALWFLKYWHKLRDRAALLKPGEMIRAHRNGRITQVKPKRKSS